MNKRLMKSLCGWFALVLILCDVNVSYARVDMDHLINEQKKGTHLKSLKSGIKVLVRHLPGSSIFYLGYFSKMGEAAFSLENKPAFRLMLSSLSAGTKTLTKDNISKRSEELSIGFKCDPGIDFSFCELSGTDPYFASALDLTKSLILEPMFPDKELKVIQSQMEAALKSESEDPESILGDKVNELFYGRDHPYFFSSEDGLRALAKTESGDVREAHRQWVGGEKFIVVISSRSPDEIVKLLDEKWADFARGEPRTPSMPKLSYGGRDKSIVFYEKDIATGYLMLKTEGLSALDPDQTAGTLMLRMLGEKLDVEVRTKRSLSYAVHAFNIPNLFGATGIAASTSQPRKTLETVRDVLKAFVAKVPSKAEVEESKAIYETAFFMTLEEHRGLGMALARQFAYFGSADRLYELPRQLRRVTGSDVQRVAKKVLHHFRMGLIFKKEEFQKEWAVSFLKDTEKEP